MDKLPKDLLSLIAKKLNICDRNKLRVLNKRMNENVKKIQKQFGISFNCYCFLEEKYKPYKIGCYQWINNFDTIDVNEYFKFYAEYGCLNGLKHLVKLDHNNAIDIHYDNELAFQYAANGHLHILKYLLSLESSHGKIDIHADNEWAFRHAVKDGQLHILKYLISLEATHGKIDIHAESEYAFDLAARFGHLHILKFLISLKPTHGRINIHALNDRAFRYATKNRHDKVVEYLKSLE